MGIDVLFLNQSVQVYSKNSMRWTPFVAFLILSKMLICFQKDGCHQ